MRRQLLIAALALAIVGAPVAAEAQGGNLGLCLLIFIKDLGVPEILDY
jgi:hypothetical protein